MRRRRYFTSNDNGTMQRHDGDVHHATVKEFKKQIAKNNGKISNAKGGDVQETVLHVNDNGGINGRHRTRNFNAPPCVPARCAKRHTVA
eukprot:gene1286-biopygen21299